MPSLTITYSAQEGARVATAYGRMQDYRDAQGASRSATEAEVKAALIAVMKGWVRQHEHQEAVKAINIPAFDPL